MREFIDRNINNIIVVFLLLQPIIDVLTSISSNILKLDITFGIVIRVLFLLLLTGYNLFFQKSSKKTKLVIFLGGIYVGLFIINVVIQKDIAVVFYEFKNLFRYLYFPFMLINLYEISKKNSITIKDTTINKIYFTYIALILIPMLTNTDFVGYFEGKVGTIGWFSSTNEISAILSGLLPFVILRKQYTLKDFIFLIPILIVLLSLGSKITIVSFVFVFIFLLILKFKQVKYKKKFIMFSIPVLIIGVICTALILPRTNFYKNIKIHLDFLGVDNVVDILKDEELIDHFIFSSRLTFLENTRENYLDSDVSTKFLGVGFIENYATDEVNLKTIEMDIFDIFYRLGIIGFILYLIAIYIVLSDRRYQRSVVEDLSIGVFLFISCLAGHVLTSPAVSIYLCVMILSCVKENELCKQL